MGVPKFYRWTSERYPCLSQVIKEHQIPEFDNLYLDMNGIIHICSHPNDDDPHFRISEADIFKNIFHYIEVLFRIIKPKQNFFMAVDGVAPRAKMNQQRGRRFRTAKEAEDNIRKALQKGQTLPKEERFDSNCITPGTEFMARLNDHLQYFVNKKVSADPLWKSCNVYLSGHDVPGEGEHKIMDFIRYEKSKENYDPNIRHCLYGLDADLLVLGMACHEPHFSLLREEVRFGKKSKRVSKPEETTFHLLHLSLMREYLDFEFSELKKTLPFEYDLEKIIDDWVLLGFLVGNDFIPHLPNLHINHDALPYLHKVYIETMPKLDGYLHDGGSLSLTRFQKFLDAVSKFDRERFEDVYTDMKWLEGRTGRSLSSGRRKKNGSGKKKFSQLLSQMDDDILFPVKNPYMALADDSADDSGADSASSRSLDDGEARELAEMFGDMGVKETDGGEELFELEFRQNKRAYYIEKFNVPTADDSFIAEVAHEYILAIQWILHYYFNGLQSWSWYYPYHYAPYVSDLTKLETFDLKLDKGRPFKPFEQLLAVLPSASKKLLPEAFQSLMIMDTSPIIDYYPTSFQTDLNGKQQDWEAVVLIPFIDEKRLLSAMKTHNMRLTDEEKARNSYGSCMKYNYSDHIEYCFPSTFPGVFNDIEPCRAKCQRIDKDLFRIPIKDLKKGLCEGVKEDVYFPGFPTLKHINHYSDLRKAGVRVFQYSSKSNNMVVHIGECEKPDADEMHDLVGKVVHVEWPYLVEALVTAVTDGKVKYILKEPENTVQKDILDKSRIEDAQRWMNIAKTRYLEKKGIEVGDVDVLVEAKQLKGKRYVCGHDGIITLEKEWADSHSFYPYQSIVQDLSVHTSRFQKELKSLEELFPVNSKCFMMANPYYGCTGEVLEVDNGRVRVSLSASKEPDLSEVITNQSDLADKYFPSDRVGQKVGISPKLLSRITGNLFVRKGSKNVDVYKENPEKRNIGLKLKYSGRNKEVLGYARRTENGWTFSEPAIDILSSYVKRFPKIFGKLAHLPEQEIYDEEDIFPGKTGKNDFEEVLSFIRDLPCHKSDPVKCGSMVLDEKIVLAIERAVADAKLQQHLAKQVKVKVKPHVLFKPTAEFGRLVPDPATEYYLFDRVVNVRDGGLVPFGLRGTIIGVHEVQDDENNEDSLKEIKYEVLFDEPFHGGLMLRCEETKGAYLTSSNILNISHGERKEAAKKGRASKSLTHLQGKAETKSFTSPSTSKFDRSTFSPQRGNRPGESSGRYGSPQRPSGSPNWRNQSGDGRRSYDSGTRSDPASWRGSDRSDDGNYRNDYWLKGYGNESPNNSNNKGYSVRKRNEASSWRSEPAKPREKKVDTDFLKLLSKITKPEDGPNKSSDSSEKLSAKHEHKATEKDAAKQPEQETDPPQKVEKKSQGRAKTLEEETALLQEMLGMKSSSKHHQPSDALETILMPAPFSTSMHTPPRQPVNVLNQLFQSPQPAKAMVNVPASPTSPLVKGSTFLSPTASLQNWCHENQMPVPNYTYSSTPQGVHAVVRIGPAICYGGLMCKSKPDAAESAAGVALKQLLTRQTEVDKLMASSSPSIVPPFLPMQPHHPGNSRPFINPQQQMLLQQQNVVPRWRPPPQHHMSPRMQQQQLFHTHAQQMQHQQRFLMQQLGNQRIPFSGPHLAHRPPQPDPVTNQELTSSDVDMTRKKTDCSDKEVSSEASLQKKRGGDIEAKAAFIPLQVNRANKRQSKTSTHSGSNTGRDEDKVAKKDVKTKQTDKSTAKEFSTSAHKMAAERSTENAEVRGKEKATDASDVAAKPSKDKAKKKVLLAPSFFAPKK
eukprot:gene14879-16425_t